MKRTPLYEAHVALKAKVVPFGGWEMPLSYSGIIAEHKAVRTACGIFDIGHMGAVSVFGSEALPYLQRLLTNDLSKLPAGSSHYSLLLNTSGGVIDDVFVYRPTEDRYMIVLNASNTEKDMDWMTKNNDEGASIEDLKDNMTLLALQGPRAQEMLQGVCELDLKSLGHHRIADSKVLNIAARVSRTGYTGEDGFELFFERSKAGEIWKGLIKLGATPCGLGARDTLRLEAGMPLYGHEYNEGITPLETPFMFAVKMDKGEFIGSHALLMQKEHGISKKLVGLKLDGGIPRQGFRILKNGELVGYVTSGTLSPTLNYPIGMGFVRVERSEVGGRLDVEVRGKLVPATVVKLPFYKR